VRYQFGVDLDQVSQQDVALFLEQQANHLRMMFNHQDADKLEIGVIGYQWAAAPRKPLNSAP